MEHFYFGSWICAAREEQIAGPGAYNVRITAGAMRWTVTSRGRLILNYNECLRCTLVHPALNRLTEYLVADNEPVAQWDFAARRRQ